jgi:hypothetical protein
MTRRQINAIADAIKELPLGADGEAMVKMAEKIADVMAEIGYDRDEFLERACDLG